MIVFFLGGGGGGGGGGPGGGGGGGGMGPGPDLAEKFFSARRLPLGGRDLQKINNFQRFSSKLLFCGKKKCSASGTPDMSKEWAHIHHV